MKPLLLKLGFAVLVMFLPIKASLIATAALIGLDQKFRFLRYRKQCVGCFFVVQTIGIIKLIVEFWDMI